MNTSSTGISGRQIPQEIKLSSGGASENFAKYPAFVEYNLPASTARKRREPRLSANRSGRGDGSSNESRRLQSSSRGRCSYGQSDNQHFLQVTGSYKKRRRLSPDLGDEHSNSISSRGPQINTNLNPKKYFQSHRYKEKREKEKDSSLCCKTELRDNERSSKLPHQNISLSNNYKSVNINSLTNASISQLSGNLCSKKDSSPMLQLMKKKKTNLTKALRDGTNQDRYSVEKRSRSPLISSNNALNSNTSNLTPGDEDSRLNKRLKKPKLKPQAKFESLEYDIRANRLFKKIKSRQNQNEKTFGEDSKDSKDSKGVFSATRYSSVSGSSRSNSRGACSSIQRVDAAKGYSGGRKWDRKHRELDVDEVKRREKIKHNLEVLVQKTKKSIERNSAKHLGICNQKADILRIGTESDDEVQLSYPYISSESKINSSNNLGTIGGYPSTIKKARNETNNSPNTHNIKKKKHLSSATPLNTVLKSKKSDPKTKKKIHNKNEENPSNLEKHVKDRSKKKKKEGTKKNSSSDVNKIQTFTARPYSSSKVSKGEHLISKTNTSSKPPHQSKKPSGTSSTKAKSHRKVVNDFSDRQNHLNISNEKPKLPKQLVQKPQIKKLKPSKPKKKASKQQAFKQPYLEPPFSTVHPQPTAKTRLKNQPIHASTKHWQFPLPNNPRAFNDENNELIENVSLSSSSSCSGERDMKDMRDRDREMYNRYGGEELEGFEQRGQDMGQGEGEMMEGDELIGKTDREREDSQRGSEQEIGESRGEGSHCSQGREVCEDSDDLDDEPVCMKTSSGVSEHDRGEKNERKDRSVNRGIENDREIERMEKTLGLLSSFKENSDNHSAGADLESNI